jgi:hypothetical protein
VGTPEPIVVHPRRGSGVRSCDRLGPAARRENPTLPCVPSGGEWVRRRPASAL